MTDQTDALRQTFDAGHVPGPGAAGETRGPWKYLGDGLWWAPVGSPPPPMPAVVAGSVVRATAAPVIVVTASWLNDGTASLDIACNNVACGWTEEVGTGNMVELGLDELLYMVERHGADAHPARPPLSVTDPANPCHKADTCTMTHRCELYRTCNIPQCTVCMQGTGNDCDHFTAR